MRKKYLIIFLLLIPALSFSQDKVTTEGIPGNVNSSFQDVRPVIADNGKNLYLNRRFHPENIRGDKDFQDVWISRYDARGVWSKPTNLGEPYNNKQANDLVRVSASGDSMVFVNADYKGLRAELSLFLKGNKDGADMRIDGFYNKSPYVDFDYNFKEKVIIMAVERKDTKGDQDLYFSVFQPQENTYSTPMSMGESINTDKADFAPFLTTDGNTLFFASYGHKGKGGADLYMSHRKDDSWSNWTIPENLGNIINTAFEETFVSIDPALQYLYYDSYPSGATNRDIWRATLSDELRNKIIEAKSKVRNSIAGTTASTPIGKPIEASAILETEEASQPVVSSPPQATLTEELPDKALATEPANNETPQIPQNTDKSVTETAELSTPNEANTGFFARIGEKLGIAGNSNSVAYGASSAKGTKIMSNVYFKFNSDRVQNRYNGLLTGIYEELEAKPQSKILLEGHTDGIGGENINIDLSCRRAKSIKESLVALGVNSLRIEISCEGKERPMASNDDEVDGRELNRRVEFYLF